MVGIINTAHRITDLNTWSPTGGMVCKGYSSFRRQTLAGRNTSPWVDFGD